MPNTKSKILYHGSTKIIERPVFGGGKLYNDYGAGFYCTESVELAKEWACANGKDGFANQYELPMDNLKVMNLNQKPYHILNWLAVLLQNRKFAIAEGLPQRAKAYILEHFLPDYADYDVIVGYRADDSYFAYAGDFINNTLSLSDLKRAMSLGKLGEQIVLKSREAFDLLRFVDAISAESAKYHSLFVERDTSAREKYREMAKQPSAETETYVLDVIRNNWTNDEPGI